MPLLLKILYFNPKEHSTNLAAIAKKPAKIIQSVAPGPPKDIATATPAMFPRPTVPESAAVSAWKCVTSPFDLLNLFLNFPEIRSIECLNPQIFTNFK